MDDVPGTSVQTSGNASKAIEQPKKEITLLYIKVQWTDHQFNAVGTETEFESSYWDLIRNSGTLDGTKVETDMDGEFNPTDTDDDGDGVPDDYENQNQKLSLEDDADEDLDGDFQSNHQRIPVRNLGQRPDVGVQSNPDSSRSGIGVVELEQRGRQVLPDLFRRQRGRAVHNLRRHDLRRSRRRNNPPRAHSAPASIRHRRSGHGREWSFPTDACTKDSQSRPEWR